MQLFALVKRYSTRAKLIVVFVTVTLLSGISAFSVGTVVKNQAKLVPLLCSQCHQMERRVAGWKSSGHNQVSCLNCHTEVPFAAILFKTRPVVAGETTVLARTVTNSTCLKCHSPTNDVKMPGDLVNPHKAHLDKNLDCVDCHRWTGHSPPATSTPGPFKEAGGPSMIKCLTCHNGVKAPNNRSTCHTEKKVPDSHAAKSWGISHGQNLTAKADTCNKCHGYNTKQEAKGSFKDFDLSPEIKGELPGTVNCAQCHSPGHQANWDKDHIPTVQAQGPAKCQACHSLEGCLSCHRARTGK